jgi:hypothetical protein
MANYIGARLSLISKSDIRFVLLVRLHRPCTDDLF